MTTIPTEQRLVAPIYASPAILRQYVSPRDSRRYAYVMGRGLFSWSASSAATDDGVTAIAPTGAATGRWLIADASGDIVVGQGTSPASLAVDRVYQCDGNALVGNLPAITAENSGHPITIIAGSAGMTVNPSGTQTVNESASLSIAANRAVKLIPYYDNADWLVLRYASS